MESIIMSNPMIDSTLLVSADDYQFIEELELGGYTHIGVQ